MQANGNNLIQAACHSRMVWRQTEGADIVIIVLVVFNRLQPECQGQSIMFVVLGVPHQDYFQL